MQPNIWQRKNVFANWIAPRFTTHCFQIADYQSIQMLAFDFASRTFAYRRLAKGLNRSRSAFWSFLREYLDKAIKADQSAQYVDDIGIAANDTKQLCTNIRTAFECIRNARLKLSMSKCHFRVKQVDFLDVQSHQMELALKPTK